MFEESRRYVGRKELTGMSDVLALLDCVTDAVLNYGLDAETKTHKTEKHGASINCADNLQFMKGLEDESMQLIITSPPYNIGKAYESRATLDSYISSQATVINECLRLLHPRGSICWQVGNHVQNGEIFPLDMMLYSIFKQRGLRLRNRIIWHFEHG